MIFTYFLINISVSNFKLNVVDMFLLAYNYAAILHTFSARTGTISWSVQGSSDTTLCRNNFRVNNHKEL